MKPLSALRILTLLITAGAWVPGFAQAGNSAFIKQTGEAGLAEIVQGGKNNRAIIIQGDTGPVTRKARSGNRGSSRAVIRQEGDHNVARQTQSGSDNVALVGQQGIENKAVQTQTGKSNWAGAVQDGNRNEVFHSQTGGGHMHTIVERGNGKKVTVSQSGLTKK
jgi:curlin associated repeat protein